MEIMLSHLGIGMAYDALDGLNIHAQRLQTIFFPSPKNWILECFSLTDCGISCKI